MIGRFLSLVFLLAVLADFAVTTWAAEPAAIAPSPEAAPGSLAPSTRLVVLRNGEVLAGQVSREGDRTIVATEGTEIRLSPREVDFVCQTLDEAYAVQQNRVVAGRIEDHLNLADWCLRHQLLGDAAREITAAMEIDPKNRRMMLLDDRLRRALLPEPTKAPGTDETIAAARPVSAEGLERLVRSMPTSTVETFTATIQPMLLNYCATAGCHGPSSQSSFTLSRAPLEKVASRRLTERNLYNTLQWIDHDNPIDSKLLSAAREPHGPNQASGATGVGTAKYQELASWVLQASPNIAINPTSVASRGASSAPVATLPTGPAGVLASPSPASLLVPITATAPASMATTSKTRKTGVANTAGAKSGLPSQKLAPVTAALNAANIPVEQPDATANSGDAN
jgi:hypothetical protein